MLTLVLTLLALSCLTLFLYPYFLYPLVLRALSARPIVRNSPAGSASDFAVLFCAYNEEASATAKLENIGELLAMNPGLEVLIYDDGSTDRSAEIFESRPDLVRLVRGPGRRGKAFGMKALVKRTNRPFLVFTDANVMLDPDCVERLSEYFRSAEIGGVCGHLVYERQTDSATEVVGGRYWSLEERVKALESRTGNVMGGDGSIFAVRRELYPQFPDTVQDDFTVTMSVVFSGRRLVFANDVVARERLVSSSADEYRRKVRIAARAHHTHLTMRRSLRRMSSVDRWKYGSHKVLRWYGALFLAAFVGFGTAASLTLSLPAVAALWLLGAAALSVKTLRRRIAPVLEICLAVIATFHGLVLAKTGRTFATWTPPKSR